MLHGPNRPATGRQTHNIRIILGMGSTNERRCYRVMPPLIGWAHILSDFRDHSGYELSQWEKALLSNAFSHWLNPNPERSLQYWDQGAVSIRKTVLPGMAIPMLKIRRPNGRLIFNMEIAIRIDKTVFILRRCPELRVPITSFRKCSTSHQICKQFGCAWFGCIYVINYCWFIC